MPNPITPDAEKFLDAKITEVVEKALASRPAPAAAPAVIKSKMFETKSPALAALGIRAKATFAAAAEKHGWDVGSLKEFVGKAAGIFEGVLEQGGIWAQETKSSETIEVLRSSTVLLQAGARVESGYGSKLTIGRINEGATATWEGEGAGPAESDLGTGLLQLGAYKVMAHVRLSGSLLAKAGMQSAEQVGADVAASIGLKVDQAGFFGTGGKQPLGIQSQVVAANKFAIAGTTDAQKEADLDKLVKVVAESDLPIMNNGAGYFMAWKTLFNLRAIRSNGIFVFEGLRNLAAPTINGFPVYVTESFAGKNLIAFGLANQLYFGAARPLETRMGLNGTDFKEDMQSLLGVAEVDWALRHQEAFSFLTGVTY